MNPIYILLLRSVGLLAGLQGQAKLSQTLGLLADGVQSNQDVDAHLKSVADDLAAGKEPDPAALAARINAQSDRLQGD